MTKKEFLNALGAHLSSLSTHEVEEQIRFYGEIIDDRVEDGLDEEEAVAQIGNVDELAARILAELPPESKKCASCDGKRRLGALEITLLAVGSPIWLALGISASALLISLAAVLWSVVVAAWSVFVSFAAVAVACLPVGIGFAVGGYLPSGLALVGACLVLGGLAIFAFFGCRATTRGSVWLTKWVIACIGRVLVRRERV